MQFFFNLFLFYVISEGVRISEVVHVLDISGDHEDVQGSGILNLGIRWRRIVILTHRPLSPLPVGGKTPYTHQIAHWVGPKNGLVTKKRRKSSYTCWQSNRNLEGLETAN